MPYIIGIDPGLTGALTLVDTAGHLVSVDDMPVIAGELDPAGVLDVLRDYLTYPGGPVEAAVLEWPGIMPKNGAKSARSMGMALKGLEVALVASGIPVVKVPPSKWKTAIGLGKSKDASRALARSSWPDHAREFARVKDDGRAEAALVAVWWLGKGPGARLAAVL